MQNLKMDPNDAPHNQLQYMFKIESCTTSVKF
jgi:hypothetical protein